MITTLLIGAALVAAGIPFCYLVRSFRRLRGELASKSSHAKIMETIYNSASARASRMEQKMQEAVEDRNEVLEQRRQLQARLEIAEHNFEFYREEYLRVDTSLGMISKERNELAELLDTQDKDIQFLQMAYAQKNAKVVELTAKVVELTAKVVDLDALANRQDRAVVEATQITTGLQKERDELRQKLTAEEGHVKNYRDAYCKVVCDLNETQKERDSLGITVAQQKAALLRIRAERDNYCSLAEERRKVAEIQRAELTALRDQHASELDAAAGHLRVALSDNKFLDECRVAQATIIHNLREKLMAHGLNPDH